MSGWVFAFRFSILLLLAMLQACTSVDQAVDEAAANVDEEIGETAATPDAGGTADVAAPEDALELPDLHDLSETMDMTDAQPDSSVVLPPGATVEVSADPPRLVPPIPATLSATYAGMDVTQACSWTIGTPSVCAMLDATHVQRTGAGTCSIACSVNGVVVGVVGILHTPQPVLYLFGGEGSGAVAVSRLRVADKEWDPIVTAMPYSISDGAVGTLGGAIFIVGGNGTPWPPMDGSKDCPSDIAGCVGPTCKPGCVDKTATKCPKESVADPKPSGCGTIWELDLVDASWHAVGVGPAKSFVGGYAQVGAILYVTVHELIDLVTAIHGVQSGGEMDTAGNPIGPFRAPFGDGVVATQYGNYFSVWTPSSGVWEPAFQPHPCHVGAPTIGIGAFQMPQPTVVWAQTWNAATTNCPASDPAGTAGPPPYAYRTWLSTGGPWQPGPQLPLELADEDAYTMVSWSGGVFFFNDMGKYPTYLLASPGDHFEEFPPCPIQHVVSTMAVVVMQ